MFSDNRPARRLLMPCLAAIGAILALGVPAAGAHSDTYGGAEELRGPRLLRRRRS
jgi:hypothetical protein